MGEGVNQEGWALRIHCAVILTTALSEKGWNPSSTETENEGQSRDVNIGDTWLASAFVPKLASVHPLFSPPTSLHTIGIHFLCKSWAKNALS